MARSAATISEHSWRAVTFGTHPSFSRALVGVAEQGVYLSGPEVARVNPDDDVSRLHGRAGLVLDRVDYADLIQPFALKAQA